MLHIKELTSAAGASTRSAIKSQWIHADACDFKLQSFNAHAIHECMQLWVQILSEATYLY